MEWRSEKVRGHYSRTAQERNRRSPAPDPKWTQNGASAGESAALVVKQSAHGL